MPVTATGRIHSLPAVLASQIAAGEVIERPASVVKELLENSLDAGASRIQIDVEAAGNRLIRVRDDGAGIHPDDLSLSLAPHSTSKIRSVEDLAAISSLGFRGEALASIAACARLRVCSAQAEAAGREIEAEPDQPPAAPAPVAHPPGTTMEVRDLFFNIPARRKFLRSEQTEFLHILELVKSFSLARPALGLKLTHNGRTAFSVAVRAGFHDRVATIFGRRFAEQACAVDVSHDRLRLSGIAGKPETARSQADRQYLFLNGRLIRDRRLNHALRQAYGDHLPAGRYAPLLLYLEMDPAGFDINVHPTKHEVRFRAARDVHDFLYSALRQSLEAAQPVNVAASSGPADTAATATQSPRQPPLAEQVADTAAPAYRASPPAANRMGDYLARVGHYLLSRNAAGLVLTDVRQALEQLTALELRQARDTGELGEQPLLLPQTQTVTAAQTALVERCQGQLADCGIRLETTAPTQVALRAMPRQMPAVGPDCLGELLQWLTAGCKSDDLMRQLAHHAANHYERVLEREPPAQLLQRLDAAAGAGQLENPWPWRQIDADQLAQWWHGG